MRNKMKTLTNLKGSRHNASWAWFPSAAADSAVTVGAAADGGNGGGGVT